jgi:hypothetical protein
MTAMNPAAAAAAPRAAAEATDAVGAPTRSRRVAIATAVGLAVAAYVVARARVYPSWVADIAQSWVGARALLRGQNPYLAVGPMGTAMYLPWPLFYPLPALLFTAPFTLLPMDLFRPVFLGGSSAWLAYVVTRRDYWRLALFGSAAFLGAIASGAWEPLLVAAALTPGAAALYLAKPNVGLALASALPVRRATVVGIGIAVALFVVSVIIRPGWIGDWREALRAGTHFAGPLTRPGGFLILAALAKWRRAEARLLVAMAAVPQTMMLQAALPLFLVARSRTETMLLAMLSFIPYAVQLHAATQAVPFQVLTDRTGTLIALCLYLPCVVMLLRRPNRWSALDDA